MKKRFVAGLALAGVLSGLVAVGAPARAESLTGWLFDGPVKIGDTHDVGAGAKAGPDPQNPLRVTGITGGLVQVTVSEPSEAGVLYVWDCNDLAADPQAFVAYNAAETVSNLIRLGDGAATDFCFSPTALAHVKVERWATEGSAALGAKNFVGISATSLFDAEVTAGTDGVTAALTGLSAGATEVSLLVTLPDGGSATVFGCGTTPPPSPSIVGGEGTQSAALATLGGARTLCVRANGATGTKVKVQVSLTGSFSATDPASSEGMPYVVNRPDALNPSPGLDAVTPERLFDTRDNNGARRPAASVYELDLSSKAPAGARSVVMNVTATDPVGAGFVTVYPCDIVRPTASNLNYVAGQTVPNLVTVALGQSAKVCFYTHNAAHLIADLSGWYVLGAGDAFKATTPKRLFDTRTNNGARIVANSVFQLDLHGQVDDSATAVTMNVTVDQPVSDGFLTVYPCDGARPTASNLNYDTNQTVPNLVTVKVGVDMKVCFFAQKSLHLLADLAGYFAPLEDSGFRGLPPQRLVDTRDDPQGALRPGDVVRIRLPLPNLTGALFNVTAVDPTSGGFITAYPCDTEVPLASNLNFVTGRTVPNLVAVALSANSEACFYAQNATHLVVDLSGVYTTDQDVDNTPLLTVDSVRAGATPLVV